MGCFLAWLEFVSLAIVVVCQVELKLFTNSSFWIVLLKSGKQASKQASSKQANKTRVLQI